MILQVIGIEIIQSQYSYFFFMKHMISIEAIIFYYWENPTSKEFSYYLKRENMQFQCNKIP